jgi:hypothetical protein
MRVRAATACRIRRTVDVVVADVGCGERGEAIRGGGCSAARAARQGALPPWQINRCRLAEACLSKR